MKLFVGWVISAGAVVTAAAAGAQGLPRDGNGAPRYVVASDIGGPYAAMPPAPPRNGPQLLPPREVYGVLREHGYSALGAPQQRGFVYTIAAINPDGDDGRLVIDARTGQIIRFMLASRMGDAMNDDLMAAYGPPGPPPVNYLRYPPRPPAPVPHVASRTRSVPLPKAMPARPVAEPQPVAATPEPAAARAQQSAAIEPKPGDAATPPPAAAAPAAATTAAPAAPAEPAAKTPPAAPQQSAAIQSGPADTAAPAAGGPPAATAAPVAAKPSAQILPTQPMPPVQDLE